MALIYSEYTLKVAQAGDVGGTCVVCERPLVVGKPLAVAACATRSMKIVDDFKRSATDGTKKCPLGGCIEK